MSAPERGALPRDALPEDRSFDDRLRPGTLAEMVGQDRLRENLAVFIDAARRRKEPLDHLLFYGPPGLGKTSLARIVAREMGAPFRATSGPVLERASDLGALLSNLEGGDVLFIDEIHRLPPAVEEILYLDGGLTWISVKVPFSRCDLSFLDANNGWAFADLGAGAGSNAVAVYQTTDGGVTWKQTYSNDPNSSNASASLPLGGMKSGLTPLNMQTAWVSGVIYSSRTVYLFRTDDGGVNWAPVTTLPLPAGAENSELGFEPVKFVTATDAFVTARVVSDQTKLAVYVSKDAGNTWSLTPTLIPNCGSTDFLSATEMVIYNGEQFYITHDAARTWSIIPPDIIFGDTFAMMDFVNTLTGWVITVDPTTNQRRVLDRFDS